MSTMALQLPSSFVDVERDEMEYVEGGHTDIIPDWVLGTAINVGIGFLTDGIASGVAGFIRAKGLAQAEKIFTATVTSKLAAFGLSKLAGWVVPAVSFAMCAADIGGTIARYIDAHDAYPNDGWITI